MAKIFLFRHGQTPDNIDKVFSGWRNPDIDQEGIKQAQEIRDKLKGEKVTKAYSSDQIRSIHTLEIVLEPHQNVEVFQDPRIRERDYGDLTGQSKTETQEKDPLNYKLWHRSFDVPPPNGESIAMVEKRVLPFIEDLKKSIKPDDVVFVSASANSIRPMRKYFENMTNDQAVNYEYTPAEVFEYQI